ncbi:ArnT family glycosyltransferase [uncultured Aquimarina sp.]|uniref:ArnT family glycosyltransferase n=1 Tax=uncultured Aquimarina sp. TaxID=575652 RepID=UPI00263299E2|nr:glycosyltransferase family 39 protein [uncultured Aquimarina sp.]
MTDFLFKKDYIILYILLLIVYISGLWIPLMENDSAQHATMAMRMYLENDFLNIYKAGKDYLDKPHMHFWLAALSFKIFGISDWAYRIPALLFTGIGAISCYGLAKEFYGKQARHIASLVFLSAQAIVLSNHDVRTDAVLTGATIFGIWQLVLYINHEKVIHAILGAIGVAIAFSTKGQLGVFVAGICILTYVSYNRRWYVIWSWKTLIGMLSFIISILPVLYAYYVQFDLHPEKIIHGQSNVSGIRFILWDQSFNRLTASGFEETSPDYFFFFHTLLWAFLPWSIIAYLALFNRCKELWINKFIFKPKLETLTSLGVFIVLIVISFSKFKLPHYLNSVLPILSVLVAGYLTELYNKNKKRTSQVFLVLQYVILTIGSILVLFLIFWAFPMPHVGIILCYLLLLVGLSYVITTKMKTIRKLIILSVSYMILINFCLNTQFYPKLLSYQAGNNAARVINSEDINKTDVLMLNGRPSWSLDFYTKRITPTVHISEVSSTVKSGQWLFLYGNKLESLKAMNISWSREYEIYHHRITRLSLEFLNPNTRDAILEKAYLIQVE